jgi:hypothetical protein
MLVETIAKSRRAYFVTQPTQLFENPHQGQPLAPRLAFVRQQHPIKLLPPRIKGGYDSVRRYAKAWRAAR